MHPVLSVDLHINTKHSPYIKKTKRLNKPEMNQNAIFLIIINYSKAQPRPRLVAIPYRLPVFANQEGNHIVAVNA